MPVGVCFYFASCYETKRVVSEPNSRFDQGSSNAIVGILLINVP